MKKIIIGVFILTGVGSSAGAEEPGFLCRGEERVVFACTVGNKMVSLCASPQAGKDSGYVQYRYGTPKKIELEYPVPPEPPQGRFFLSQRAYSGGGETRIRFKNNGYDYFVFDQMIRTRFKAGEPNYPKFDSGLILRLNGKTLSIRHCKEEASVGKMAFDQFEREEFDDTFGP